MADFGIASLFLIGSKQGTVSFLWFRSHGHEEWWRWETRTYDVDDEMSFPVGDVEQYQGLLGFGYLQNPFYYVMRPIQYGWHVLGAASTTLRGEGPVLPYWFLLSIFGTLGTLLAICRNQRFGLRMMLLAMTALILLMGLAAWTFR